MSYTKEDKKLIKDLKKAGIELTGEETSEQLTALATEHGITEDAAKSGDSILEAAETKVGVKFIDPNVGSRVREFSADIHGEDFKETAQQFAAKHSGEFVAVE